MIRMMIDVVPRRRIVLLALLCSHHLYGQQDFQLWNDLKIKADLGKQWDLSFEQNIRLAQNAGRFSKAYSNLSAGYSYKDFLKLEGTYRFIVRDNSERIRYGHALVMDVTVRQRIERLRLSLRNRLQFRYMDILSEETGWVPAKYYRARLEGVYKTRKFPLDPFASAEAFVFLPKGERAALDAIRTALGAEYEINKKHTAGLYWMNEWGMGATSGEALYILGVMYTYSH